jgi:phosphatidylglycerol:prolipoprotein diacylglycerol transferase
LLPTISDPIAFSFFGIDVRWYAMFILAGIVAAIAVMYVIARRRGMDPEFILDVAPWVVVAGIVGARAYYIVLKAGYFAEHPGEALNVRLGGLTIHGALAGGILAFAWFCWRRRQPFLAWTDVVIAAVPIGQAIGRWGNWANQEAFGTPTDLPWGVRIDPAHRPPEYAAYSTFHPTFLYEGILDLGIAAILIWLVLQLPHDRRLREGDVLWTYFVLYGLARLAVERIRTDSLYIGPLPAAYWVSGALIAGGLLMIVLRHAAWTGRPAPLEAESEQGSA